MTQLTDIYKEAMRYIDNAKEILSTKAGKEGKYYNDAKYVRMACNKAYNGLLLALNGLFEYKGIQIPKNRQRNRDALRVQFYREQLGKLNKSILKDFNESAYPCLHEYGGYDGNLLVDISQNGIKTATEIIEWVKNQISMN
jgi:HEPN domain-containing protein